MHDLVVVLLEVSMFAVIFLLVGLFLVVLLFTRRMIMVLIVSMSTVMLLFIAIALVTLMLVAVLAAIMLVVQVTAARNRKISRLLFFWLLLLLELVKDTGSFLGCLALLENGKPKKIHGHPFVCFWELVPMRLWLCKKDLFALLLQ